MKKTFKNKLLTVLSSFVIALTFLITNTTNTVKAAYNVDDGAYWGITANFYSNTFEGSVIHVETSKNLYGETMHSLFWATGDVPLSNIRNGINLSDGIEDINGGNYKTYNKLGYYNVGYGIAPDGNGSWELYPNMVVAGLHKLGYPIDGDAPSINGNDLSGTAGYANLDTYEDYIDRINAQMSESWKWFGENASQRNGSNGANYGSHKAQGWRKLNAVYTWPPREAAGDVTEGEETYLATLNAMLMNGYNDTLSMLLSHNAYKLGSTANSSSKKAAFLDFAAQLATATSRLNEDNTNDTIIYDVSGLGEEGNYGIKVKYKVELLSEDEFKKYGYDKTVQGLTRFDVVKVTALFNNSDGNADTESVVAIHRYPKGYTKGQALNSTIISRMGSNWYNKDVGTTEKVGWTHIAYQAIFNYETQGIDSTGAGSLERTSSNWIGNIFAGLINFIVKQLTNLLSLYSLEELMLNSGVRGLTYWNGLFPNNWFAAAQYFYLFTFTVSMVMLLIAMIRLAFQKAASTVGNVAKKISLIEGIKKLIICSIITMLFVPIFTILIQINSMIVSTLTSLIPDGMSLDFNLGSSTAGLGGAIISAILFWVMVKMNFTYILRAITVLICYILAPIAIMCSAVGDKFTQITSNWLRELIGNIFIQSIHALIMMVFITIGGGGGANRIEKLVLVYSFIPLTEFIRTNLFNLGKGMDSVAEGLTSGMASLGAGAVGAATGVLRGAAMKTAFAGRGTSAGGNGMLKDKSSGLNNNNIATGMPKDNGEILTKGAKARDWWNNSKGAGAIRGLGAGVRGLTRAGVFTGSMAAGAFTAASSIGLGATNSQGRPDIGLARQGSMAMGAAASYGAITGMGAINNGINNGIGAINNAIDANEENAWMNKYGQDISKFQEDHNLNLGTTEHLNDNTFTQIGSWDNGEFKAEEQKLGTVNQRYDLGGQSFEYRAYTKSEVVAAGGDWKDSKGKGTIWLIKPEGDMRRSGSKITSETVPSGDYINSCMNKLNDISKAKQNYNNSKSYNYSKSKV